MFWEAKRKRKTEERKSNTLASKKGYLREGGAGHAPEGVLESEAGDPRNRRRKKTAEKQKRNRQNRI